jgi:hypothetical protein
MAQHHNLGGNTQGNLIGRLSAQIQADWRMNTLKEMGRHACMLQGLKDMFDLGRATNHAHIRGPALQGST